MKPIEDCTVGIVGLGLMGSAFALALRPLGPARIIALETDGETLAAAKAQGFIDEGLLLDKAATRNNITGSGGADVTGPAGQALGRCDLIFLCLNPSTLIRFMDAWMDAFRFGALITDIAGIKGNIVSAVEKTLRPDLDFIPGHPMAGSEKGGFAQARNCNFQGKNYILTPLGRNKPENLDFLRGIIRRMGFGRITETTPEEHDRKIAFTSQLCHVIAASLIDCEADREITRFGGGSFEDLTRIAMLNASLWTELFLENKTALLRRIEQFEGSLEAFKALISGGDEEALKQRLTVVRDRRSAMG